MALGEHFTHRRETGHLLFIEIGTGGGCGTVAGGREQLLAGVRERTFPPLAPARDRGAADRSPASSATAPA